MICVFGAEKGIFSFVFLDFEVKKAEKGRRENRETGDKKSGTNELYSARMSEKPSLDRSCCCRLCCRGSDVSASRICWTLLLHVRPFHPHK